MVLKIGGFNSGVLVLAVVLHILFYYALHKLKSKPQDILNSVVFCYLLIIASLLVSSLIYDSFFDGNAYHQEAVVRLRDGWNPYYKAVPDASAHNHVVNFPKFTWVYASVISDIFGNIELGKSYNIIFLLAAFFYTLAFTQKFQSNKLVSLGLALLFVLNPFTLALLFSYYVDGLIALLVLISLLALINFEQSTDNSGRIENLLLLTAVSILAINAKFNGFACGIILVAYILKALCQKQYQNTFWLTAGGGG
ncbi:hypothetical protein NO1_1851, partial [Candidatus Termititenax aidoneus]